MPENTTNTGTVGLLNESLSEASAGASALNEQAARLLETSDRLSDRLFDAGGLSEEYWDIQSIRLGLEAISSGADLVSAYTHDAEDHAEGLAELVQVVEKLKAT